MHHIVVVSGEDPNKYKKVIDIILPTQYFLHIIFPTQKGGFLALFSLVVETLGIGWNGMF